MLMTADAPRSSASSGGEFTLRDPQHRPQHRRAPVRARSRAAWQPGMADKPITLR
jgi:hypothetical protein